MRTTVDLPPALLAGAKRLAAERRTTLSAVIVEALAAELKGRQRRKPRKPFELIVRGRSGARFPTPAEVVAASDADDAAALRIPRLGRRAAP